MKPSSPTSLLLFLSLTTAFPLPPFSRDCLRYPACQSWLRSTFSPSSQNDHTPPTRLPTNPHFPDHQLYPLSSAKAHRELEEAFNNSPLTPPEDHPPTIALSTLRPLHSSYLLSLSSPKPFRNSNPTTKDANADHSTSLFPFPSMPTSALPQLRVEDTLRYRATIASKPPGEVLTQAIEKNRSCGGMAHNIKTKGRKFLLAREYSDLLVVGIVVLFLAAVVIMEAAECLGYLISAFCCKDRRRGEIFLPDESQRSVGPHVSTQLPPTRQNGDPELVGKDIEKEEYHD